MEPTTYKLSIAWLLTSLVFWLVGGAIASMTVIVPVIAFIMIVRALLLYFTTSVTLDQTGVSLHRGTFTKTEQRLALGNINAVTTKVGILGNRFDYGTILLTVGNDRNQITVGNLEGCRDLKQQLDPMLAR